MSRAEFMSGGAFLFDGPEQDVAIWGHGDEILQAEHELLLFVAPPGAGKTTAQQQRLLARLGFSDGRLFGYPVAPLERGQIVYVTADRPSQARRSLRRMVGTADRDVLDRRLVVWRGPLPFNIAKQPEALAEWLVDQDAAEVHLDSLGALLPGLTSDENGMAFMQAMTYVAEAGIDPTGTHHDRKLVSGATRGPRTLDDVYGSRFITAAAGSVLFFDGEPDSLTRTVRHLKAPAEEVGPLDLALDKATGTFKLLSGTIGELLSAEVDGVTAKGAACWLFNVAEPSSSEVEKARRKLETAARRGHARRVPSDHPKAPARYVAVKGREATVNASRELPDQSRNGSTEHHAPITAIHAGAVHAAPPPTGGSREANREAEVLPLGSLEDEVEMARAASKFNGGVAA